MELSKINRISLWLALLIGGMSVKYVWACDKPILHSPVQMEIGDVTPSIEWSSVPDAKNYMIWIESRTPEGRLLATDEQIITSPYYQPAKPLTSQKATVRVKVVAMCKDNTKSEMSARFRIDGGLGCAFAVVQAPVLKADPQQLIWQKPANANAFEVRVHEAVNGRPVKVMETAATYFDLGSLGAGPWVVEVQPMCGPIKGRSEMRMVTIP